jgi:hypothetical protein
LLGACVSQCIGNYSAISQMTVIWAKNQMSDDFRHIPPFKFWYGLDSD